MEWIIILSSIDQCPF